MDGRTHRAAKAAAAIKGQSLNQYMIDAIDAANIQAKNQASVSHKSMAKKMK